MATISADAPIVVLKSVFQKYDKDNSGSINALELKGLCYDLGYYLNDDEVILSLRILDKDGGGNIDFNEFVAFWKDNKKFKKLESSKGERLKQAITYFRYFDKDNSGSVTADEYVQLHADLLSNNLIPANITADAGLRTLDTTGDKKVSFNEFITYMDKVQQVDIPTLPGIIKEKITSKRITTRVLQSGPQNGIPVLFIHGLACSATFWEETMLALPSGYRGIAFDIRGHAGADPSVVVDATRGAGDQSDDAFALLDALNINQAHIVGNSYGGFILFDMIRKNPARVISACVVAPAPPFGWGTCDAAGALTTPDCAGTGIAQLPPVFYESVRTTNRDGARGVLALVFFAPLLPARIEVFVDSFLSAHFGALGLPGDSVPSVHWPFSGPGKYGSINSMSGLYNRNARLVIDVTSSSPKPPVLWIWGKADAIVNERTSAIDASIQGALGGIPDFPGIGVYPATPCVSQTRALLDQYKEDGGNYCEVAFEATGHMPFIEKPEEFSKYFHAHISEIKL